MPQLGRNIRSNLTHDTVLEARRTCPTPTMVWKDGRAQIDAKLKRYRCKRHATWTGQIISALEYQTITGTDAAATVLPDLARRLIAPHAQWAGVAAQVKTLAGAPPMCQVLTTRARVRSPATAVLAGPAPGQDLQSPAPIWPPTPDLHQ